ncbi:hypothetical protein [Bartonella pachyuromydis]|uniref:Uncharacterized protein n=1 Tax=Bartonella pachyuromydis TaxID=931097 RepID=A0ABP8VKL0_9HYPH
MRRIILAVALFSIFSSVLSPITASALPVGGGWGIERQKVVTKIIERSGNKDNLEIVRRTFLSAVLNAIIIPERINLFRNSDTYFRTKKEYYPYLRQIGLKNKCWKVDPKQDGSYEWVSCEIRSNS